MKRKIVSRLMLTLLAISMLTLAFNIQPVKAMGTIRIWADGSVDPPLAPISSIDNVTYTFTDNITLAMAFDDGVLVFRDNIVINGAGYTLHGTGAGAKGDGISLLASNVTIKNITIENFWVGIGIRLAESHSVTISENTITDNDYGIGGGSGFDIWSSNFAIIKNNITNNRYDGINLYHSVDTTIWGNTIANNGEEGVDLIGMGQTSNNIFYHNNFINNTKHVDAWEEAIWDNGYPSGGNYWDNYTGVDANNDGIGDTPHDISAWGYNNVDRYPLMNPWTPLEHELVTSITAPSSITLGGSSSLNATVTNLEVNDEVDVELMLLINGTTVDSTTIPLLQAGNSYTLSYIWTPTVEGTYNVTAYAHPVAGETYVQNNQITKFVTVEVSAPPVPPEAQVGVKAGDWIKCDYTVTGWPSGTPRPEWLKVEILSVEGTTASVRVTMHMSDGTEQSDTLSVDVVAGGGTFDTLFGFVIPANCTTGDSVIMGGDGFTFNVTIDGETTRTYAGASRTVVYASFSQYGTELTYYWDKETGVMVEASTTSGGITGTAKATETNMWEAVPSPFWMQWWFYAIVAVAIIALVGTVYFLKKRKPPTPTTPPPPPESSV